MMPPLCRFYSSNRHSGVVGPLVYRGAINPHQPNNNSSTPLPCASRSWHERVARPSVTRNDVTALGPDSRHRATPKISLPRTCRQIKVEPFPPLSENEEKKLTALKFPIATWRRYYYVFFYNFCSLVAYIIPIKVVILQV